MDRMMIKSNAFEVGISLSREVRMEVMSEEMRCVAVRIGGSHFHQTCQKWKGAFSRSEGDNRSFGKLCAVCNLTDQFAVRVNG
jgi:hypothetical protein